MNCVLWMQTQIVDIMFVFSVFFIKWKCVFYSIFLSKLFAASNNKTVITSYTFAFTTLCSSFGDINTGEHSPGIKNWIQNIFRCYGTLPKTFFDGTLPKGYFPNWQVPKCLISQAATMRRHIRLVRLQIFKVPVIRHKEINDNQSNRLQWGAELCG